MTRLDTVTTQTEVQLHGFDFQIAEMAVLEGSVGKPWEWSEPSEWTCPGCGLSTNNQRSSFMADGGPWGPHWNDQIDVVARAWIIAGFDGFSGCVGSPQNPSTVQIVNRCRELLAEGFGAVGVGR